MTSPAERRVTDVIDEAIAEYFAAENPQGMAGGWVLMINDLDAARPGVDGVHLVYPNGQMPWALALGIVEMGRIVMHRGFEGEQS